MGVDVPSDLDVVSQSPWVLEWSFSEANSGKSCLMVVWLSWLPLSIGHVINGRLTVAVQAMRWDFATFGVQKTNAVQGDVESKPDDECYMDIGLV